MSTFGDVYQYGDFSTDHFIGDGTTTIFNLTYNPGLTGAIEVNIGSVSQDPANYTLFGTQLTLTPAPNAGEKIWVRYLGRRTAVPVPQISANDVETALGYIPVNSTIVQTVIGDISGSSRQGDTTLSLSLVTSGVIAGTYNGLSISSKGIVISAITPANRLNVVNFGAVADALKITGIITTTNGSASVVVIGASFVNGDVGKTVSWMSGTNNAHYLASATISSVTNGTTIILNATVGYGMSESCAFIYGTNNDTAFTNAIAALNNFPGSGGEILVPKGNYLKVGTTLLQTNTVIAGDAYGSTVIFQCYGNPCFSNFVFSTANALSEQHLGISNLTFDMSVANSGVGNFNWNSDVTISDNLVLGGANVITAFTFISSNRTMVTRNRFINVGTGIAFEGNNTQIIITNNFWNAATAYGINLGIWSGLLNSSLRPANCTISYVQIANNNMEVGSGAIGIFATPTYANPSYQDINVSGNHIYADNITTGASGIIFRGFGYGIQVDNNTLSNLQGDVITVAAHWFNVNKVLSSPFSTSNTTAGLFTSTKLVEVHDVGHNMIAGAVLYIGNTATPVGGLSLGGNSYTISNIVDTNNYMISTNTAATSTATGGGTPSVNYYTGTLKNSIISNNNIDSPNCNSVTSYNNTGAGSVINVQGGGHTISNNRVFNNSSYTGTWKYLISVDNQYETDGLISSVLNNMGGLGTSNQRYNNLPANNLSQIDYVDDVNNVRVLSSTLKLTDGSLTLNTVNVGITNNAMTVSGFQVLTGITNSDFNGSLQNGGTLSLATQGNYTQGTFSNVVVNNKGIVTNISALSGAYLYAALGYYPWPGFIHYATYQAGSFSFIVPANVYTMLFTVIGAGGGGASCQASNNSGTLIYVSGGGGGSGAMSVGEYATTPGSTLAIVVGGGGTANNSGGQSSVSLGGSAFISANGGVGSTFTSTTVSRGGDGGATTTGGNILILGGGNGSYGQHRTLIGFGNGANGPFGGGGTADTYLNAQQPGGAPGSGFGAGGGGAFDEQLSGTLYTGGSGATGLVMLQY